MSLAIIPRLQYLAAVRAIPTSASPPSAYNAAAVPGLRTPELLALRDGGQSAQGSLLAAPSRQALFSPLEAVQFAEVPALPALRGAGQAASLEALAGLSAPEVEPRQAPGPQPSAPQATASSAPVTQPTQGTVPDAAHPPSAPTSTAPATAAATARGDITLAQGTSAVASRSSAQASQQATQVPAQAVPNSEDDPFIAAWLREPVTTMQRPLQRTEQMNWLSLTQRAQPTHLFRLQESLVLPMMSRQRLRVGGVVASDIDSSHETQGARAEPDHDAIVAVSDLPQKRLEGFDLRHPLRLFYDLLNRRRHARQKLTRISRS